MDPVLVHRGIGMSVKNREYQMKHEMTRKDFLRLLCVGLAAGAGSSLLAACSKSEESAQKAETATREAPSKPAAADPCADVSALTPAELTMRNDTLKYVSVSTEPEKRCDNCKFWLPSETGATCGGCTLIKGPINPKGYCSSWFVQDA